MNTIEVKADKWAKNNYNDGVHRTPEENRSIGYEHGYKDGQKTHQQQLAEYRTWLAQTINQLNYDSSSSYDDMYIKGFEKALNKFREMFPMEHIRRTGTNTTTESRYDARQSH